MTTGKKINGSAKQCANLDSVIAALPALANAGVRELVIGEGADRIALKLSQGATGSVAGLSAQQLRAIVAGSDQLPDADPAQTSPEDAQQDADDLDTAHLDR